MQANPSKFQFIIFDKDNTQLSLKIDDNNTIDALKSVKLLGVQIDTSLMFNEHIDLLCKKAGRQINALSRVSQTLDTDTKLNLFQTFIMCHFNYCPLVWHFCSISDRKKMEKVQHRALKFIYNDFVSSYSVLRNKANKPLLYVNRMRQIMLEIYKNINGISPKYLQGFVTLKENRYCLRNSKNLEIPKFKSIKYGKNSFGYQSAKVWNTLDNDIKDVLCLNDFRRVIQSWYGPECRCSYCDQCVLSNV